MTAYASLETLSRDVQDLQRRLQSLESSQQIGSSSILGGALKIYNDLAQGVVAAGRILDPDGTPQDGLYVQDPATSIPYIWVTDGFGQLDPYTQTGGWVKPGDFQTVTGAMATVWQQVVEVAPCSFLKLTVPIASDVGTTGEIQIRHNGTGTVTNAKPVPSGTSTQFSCYWTHPATLQTGPHMFEVRAARLTGAGNLYVYHPHPLTFGNFYQFATAGGWT